MKTILVVEDDEHLRRVFRTLLEGEGFRVIEAADGQAGVAAARAHAPACIVTDTMMPRLDGLGMLAQLKALGCTRPTLIVSAVHELPPLEELKTYGVEQVLGKPFAFDKFVAAVVKLVGRQDE
jgi:CheY-like chemotaxis protein